MQVKYYYIIHLFIYFQYQKNTKGYCLIKNKQRVTEYINNQFQQNQINTGSNVNLQLNGQNNLLGNSNRFSVREDDSRINIEE